MWRVKPPLSFYKGYVMNGLIIFLVVVVWIMLTCFSANKSVAIKTGFFRSSYQKEYMKQYHTYQQLVRLLTIAIQNISNYNDFKAPFGYGLKYTLFLPNVQRVCTDTLVLTDYYLTLKDFNTGGVNIPLDYTTSNEIHAVLNMAMGYHRLFRKVFNLPTHSSQEELAIRFLILKRLCEVNKVHSIEWMLTEAIIRNTFRESKMLHLTNGMNALAQIIDKELEHIGEERLRKGLAVAIKAVCYTHPAYRKNLASNVLLRTESLKNQNFRDSKTYDLITQDFTLMNMSGYDFEEMVTAPLKTSPDQLKPLIFDCGNYLIMPLLKRENTTVYSHMPISFITVTSALNDMGIDTSAWIVDYFLKNDTGYLVWDTVNPGLDPALRKVNLGKETWSEDRHSIYHFFKITMDEIFNVSTKRS